MESSKEFRMKLAKELAKESEESERRVERMREAVHEMELEVQTARVEHQKDEREMRKQVQSLRGNLGSLITHYDRTMFALHEEKERLQKHILDTDKDLQIVQEALRRIDEDAKELESAENAVVEAQRERRLIALRRHTAAKCIQRNWRQYKLKLLLAKAKRNKKNRRF